MQTIKRITIATAQLIFEECYMITQTRNFNGGLCQFRKRWCLYQFMPLIKKNNMMNVNKMHT